METEMERKDAKKALIYDMRLVVKASDKQTYTKEELLDFFDVIAAAQDND